MTKTAQPPAVLVARDGSTRSFGAFLRAAKDARSVRVTQLAAKAGLSRANYYLLEKDKQRPSLSSAAGLLAALGIEARIPAPDDPDLEKDLDVFDGADVYALRINWSQEDRRRARNKFWTAAGTGVGAAAGLGMAGSVAAGLGGLGLGGVGLGVGALALPAVAPVAAVAIAARLLHDRSKSKEASAPPSAASSEEVMHDFTTTAESMTTEELEALLEAMKAMRDERQNGN